MDGIPGREDLHARWHSKMERLLPDPEKGRVGRYGAMVTEGAPSFYWNDVNPLEKRMRHFPMPLDWFRNPVVEQVFVPPDPDHVLLDMPSAEHLAGYIGRPSGKEFFRMIVTGTQDANERDWCNELLQDIREEDYPQLRRRDAISAFHIARTLIESDLKRGALSWWLNQFAIVPEGWRDGNRDEEA